ncbi:phospholipid scramblase 1-like isoform X2 [Panulirus ornatus]
MASNKTVGHESGASWSPSPAVHPSSDTPPKETDSLLGRQTPPPRYSTVGPSWEDAPQPPPPTGEGRAAPAHSEATDPPAAHLAHQPPLIYPQDSSAYPGWWSWVPGPAQFLPPGLEHLSGCDELTLHKKGSKYSVHRDNQQIFRVTVLEDGCHNFIMKILNNANLNVLICNKTLESEGCCSSSSTHLEVMFPPGNMVGVVQGAAMEYTVHNPSGDLLFLIEMDTVVCCRKPGYQVATRDRFIIGRMFRQKSSSCCGDRVMAVTFPPDLELRSKALLLAGALSIRHMHW